MSDWIAYCGLDCEKCDARIATVRNDDSLREETARRWSELNGVSITKEMINCTGCRMDGVKTPYCDKLCLIRQCAQKRNYKTCSDCPLLSGCETVGAIIGGNEEARKNLQKLIDR